MTTHSLYGAPHSKKAYGAGLAWRQLIYKRKIMPTNSGFIFELSLHDRCSSETRTEVESESVYFKVCPASRMFQKCLSASVYEHHIKIKLNC